jgi:hypothetical protein
MERQAFNCEQGTPEWFECRSGIPTASMFKTVMSKGDGRQTYMLKLAGERLTGEPMDSFSNAHMDRGHALEPIARALYAEQMNTAVEQVGFIRYKDAGASPDGLVGDSGMLEIKTKLPHLQLAVLMKGEVPSAHIEQVQGQLWIADREWVDFVSYWPKLPLFIKRVYRDEDFIERIEKSVEEFNAQLERIVGRFHKMEDQGNVERL